MKLLDSKLICKFIRKESIIPLLALDHNLIKKVKRYPVIAVRTFLVVFAPTIKKSVLFQFKACQDQCKARMIQIFPDTVQISENFIKIKTSSGSIPFSNFTRFRIYPAHPLPVRDGIHHSDFIFWQKSFKLWYKMSKIPILNLDYLIFIADIRNKVSDSYLLSIIRWSIEILDDAVKSLFLQNTNRISFITSTKELIYGLFKKIICVITCHAIPYGS